MIVEAVIKGAVQAATRQLAPRRRRRRSYFGKRRKRTTRRRSTTPSLEQIFGELLGNLRR